MSFDNLGLEPRILEAVSRMGYSSPTPIQAEAIPHALAGRDLVGCAQTGTGKTAAFVLPTMQRIQARPGKVKALVVTPTRELAQQIEEVAAAVAKVTRHRVAVVYGGVGYEPQKKALRRGVDVLVACPGRLLDLISCGDADLSGVEVLVLDEADRMLDMGFWPDVRRIIAKLPEQRQNLLFSATMSPDVLKVIGASLVDPVEVSVAPANTPVEAIAQSIFPVGGGQKTDLLLHLIRKHELDRVLVFTRTKHRADKVARVLERNGIRGAAIHGNRSQAQRQKALDGFKKGQYRALVATDVVARGIDVDGISHVVNFDLPNVPEDYVHRIGRTARAGRTGAAYSLLAPEEHEQLRDIERKIGAVIACEDVAGFEYTDDRMVPDPEREAAPTRKPQGQRSGKPGGGNRRGGRSRGAGAGSGSGGGTRESGGGSGSTSAGAGRTSGGRSGSNSFAGAGRDGSGGRAGNGTSNGGNRGAGTGNGGSRGASDSRNGVGNRGNSSASGTGSGANGGGSSRGSEGGRAAGPRRRHRH